MMTMVVSTYASVYFTLLGCYVDCPQQGSDCPLTGIATRSTSTMALAVSCARSRGRRAVQLTHHIRSARVPAACRGDMHASHNSGPALDNWVHALL